MSDIKWEFKEDAVPTSSDDTYYDLFRGGYLSPSKFIANEDQVSKVNDAMETIDSYLQALEDNDLIEEM